MVRKFLSLFLVSFFEGAAVMAVELIGAKMIAPYYGSSLYVWSAVLALTLGGLAVGYFIGGKISTRSSFKRTLYIIILLTALLIAVMPFTSGAIMSATLSLELRLGITISCLVFIFPPLMMCGMVSPMIIRLISTELAVVGKAAGTVFAISTLGGILATFLAGFYFIPFIGLKASSFYMAILLGIFPLVYFVRNGFKNE